MRAEKHNARRVLGDPHHIVIDACVQVVNVDVTLALAYDGYARLSPEAYFARLDGAGEAMRDAALALESAAQVMDSTRSLLGEFRLSPGLLVSVPA